MNWQQISLVGPQVFPVTLFLAALLTALATVTLRNSWNRTLFWINFSLAAAIAILLLVFHAQPGDPPSASLLIRAIGEFRLFFVDTVCLYWLPLSTMLLLLLINWPQAPGTFSTVFRREVQAGLLMVAALQWSTITADAWVQWGMVTFAGWMLTLVLSRETADSLRGKSAAACLVWFTVADLLWLLGLTTLSLVLPVSDLTTATDPELLRQLSEGQVAICVSALSLLIASLLLRCGMYPLMSWAAPAARTYRDAAWIIAGGFGSGTVLLIRWAPLLTAFEEIRWMLAGLGGLSAVLLVMIAWGNSRGPVRILFVAAGQLSLVWVGAGVHPARLPEWLTLGFSMIWLLSLVALAVPVCRRHPQTFTLGRALVFFWIVLCCLGILGQEQVLAAIHGSPEMTSSNRWLLLGGGLFNLLLSARLLFGEIQGQLSPDETAGETLAVPGVPVDGDSLLGWLVVGFLTIALLGGMLFGSYWLQFLNHVDLRRPDLAAIIMLIALVSTRTWPVSSTQQNAGQMDGWGPLRRLARSEFYVPAVINFLIVLPIRAASQISRFLEWIVFGNLTMQLPASFLFGIALRVSETDEESGEPERMWQLATAAAVMLAGVALGMFL